MKVKKKSKPDSNQAFRWMVLRFGCTLEWPGEPLKTDIQVQGIKR